MSENRVVLHQNRPNMAEELIPSPLPGNPEASRSDGERGFCFCLQKGSNMSIPVEWYPHVLPGFLVMAAIFICLPSKTNDSLLEFMRDHQVMSGIGLAISAYFFGFILNDFVVGIGRDTLVRLWWVSDHQTPPRDWAKFLQTASQALVNAVKDGYGFMVLIRSMAAATCLIGLAMLGKLFLSGDHRKYWVIALILSGVLLLYFRSTYFKARDSYDKITRDAFATALPTVHEEAAHQPSSGPLSRPACKTLPVSHHVPSGRRPNAVALLAGSRKELSAH